MKQFLIFGVFLSLIKKQKTTAKEIAEIYEVSPRTIYRYVDALCCAGVPVVTTLGKGGGISLSENFKIESICFTEEQNLLIKNALLSLPNAMSEKKIVDLAKNF